MKLAKGSRKSAEELRVPPGLEFVEVREEAGEGKQQEEAGGSQPSAARADAHAFEWDRWQREFDGAFGVNVNDGAYESVD